MSVKRCKLCGITDQEKTLSRCSACKSTYYCCKDHQVSDWKSGHKRECKLIQQRTLHGDTSNPLYDYPYFPLILENLSTLDIVRSISLLSKWYRTYISSLTKDNKPLLTKMINNEFGFDFLSDSLESDNDNFLDLPQKLLKLNSKTYKTFKLIKQLHQTVNSSPIMNTLRQVIARTNRSNTYWLQKLATNSITDSSLFHVSHIISMDLNNVLMVHASKQRCSDSTGVLAKCLFRVFERCGYDRRTFTNLAPKLDDLDDTDTSDEPEDKMAEMVNSRTYIAWDRESDLYLLKDKSSFGRDLTVVSLHSNIVDVESGAKTTFDAVLEWIKTVASGNVETSCVTTMCKNVLVACQMNCDLMLEVENYGLQSVKYLAVAEQELLDKVVEMLQFASDYVEQNQTLDSRELNHFLVSIKLFKSCNKLERYTDFCHCSSQEERREFKERFGRDFSKLDEIVEKLANM